MTLNSNYWVWGVKSPVHCFVPELLWVILRILQHSELCVGTVTSKLEGKAVHIRHTHHFRHEMQSLTAQWLIMREDFLLLSRKLANNFLDIQVIFGLHSFIRGTSVNKYISFQVSSVIKLSHPECNKMTTGGVSSSIFYNADGYIMWSYVLPSLNDFIFNYLLKMLSQVAFAVMSFTTQTQKCTVERLF